MKISWSDFEKIEMHVGTIIQVEDFPEARNPAYKLQIDFGKSLGVKKSSAQITSLYSKDALVGKQVVAVVNFPKKQIGPLIMFGVRCCKRQGCYASAARDWS